MLLVTQGQMLPSWGLSPVPPIPLVNTKHTAYHTAAPTIYMYTVLGNKSEHGR